MRYVSESFINGTCVNGCAADIHKSELTFELLHAMCSALVVNKLTHTKQHSDQQLCVLASVDYSIREHKLKQQHVNAATSTAVCADSVQTLSQSAKQSAASCSSTCFRK
jgi:hypothetical protein